MGEEELFVARFCSIRKNEVRDNDGVFFLSEISSLDEFLSTLYDFIKPDYPKFYKMDRLSQSGLLAAEVLLKDKLMVNEFDPESRSLILSNSSASADTDKKFHQSIKTTASPSLFVYTLPNIVAAEISIRNSMKGETLFFITEKFDAALLYENVEMTLSQKHLQSCVAGWVEVSNEQCQVFLCLIRRATSPGAEKFSEYVLERLYQTALCSN